MIAKASRKILGNVAIYQPGLAAANFRVSVTQGALALSKSFYLRANEHQSGFQTVEQMIVVRSGPILRNNLDALVLRFIGVRFHTDHDSCRTRRAASRRFHPISRALDNIHILVTRILYLVRLM